MKRSAIVAGLAEEAVRLSAMDINFKKTIVGIEGNLP